MVGAMGKALTEKGARERWLDVSQGHSWEKSSLHVVAISEGLRAAAACVETRFMEGFLGYGITDGGHGDGNWVRKTMSRRVQLSIVVPVPVLALALARKKGPGVR